MQASAESYPLRSATAFEKKSSKTYCVARQTLRTKNLHLYQGTGKNSQPRKVVLDSASLEEIKEAARGKGPDDYVFTWSNGNKNGKHIQDFRTSLEHSMRSS